MFGSVLGAILWGLGSEVSVILAIMYLLFLIVLTQQR